MGNKILLFFFFIFVSNCFSLGKVGYIVPGDNDKAQLVDEDLARECSALAIGKIEKANKMLLNTDLKNIGIRYEFSDGCLRIREISKEQK